MNILIVFISTELFHTTIIICGMASVNSTHLLCFLSATQQLLVENHFRVLAVVWWISGLRRLQPNHCIGKTIWISTDHPPTISTMLLLIAVVQNTGKMDQLGINMISTLWEGCVLKHRIISTFLFQLSSHLQLMKQLIYCNGDYLQTLTTPFYEKKVKVLLRVCVRLLSMRRIYILWQG